MSNELNQLAKVFHAYLRKEYSDIKTIHKYRTQFQLLVSIVLSAQTTDENVNKATKGLFKEYPNAKSLASAKLKSIEKLVFSTGFYKVKSKNIHALSKILVNEYNSRIPKTIEELVKLPGVGRKTANVVLNMAFGQPTIAVDTHLFRVSNRTKMAPGKTPLAVELKLEKKIPKEFSLHAHHWLILHGRYICKARKPSCPICPVNDLCQFKGKTKLHN